MKKLLQYIMIPLFLMVGTIGNSSAQEKNPLCPTGIVTADIIIRQFTECTYKFEGYNTDDLDNPNNSFTWVIKDSSGAIETTHGPDVGANSFFSYTFDVDDTFEVILTVETPYNGSTCTDTETNYLTVTNCEDPPANCCDIEADYSYSISNCNEYSFNGFNNGTSCISQTYKWTVNGTVVGTSEDLNYTFSNGTYNVCYTITEPGGSQRECSNTHCETIVVDCGGGPCPSASNIHYINEGGGGLCTTGQASVNGINTSNVDYVDWTWALGGYSGVINGAGTTTPIYYPSGDWTGYLISICATVVYDNGDVCPQVCRSFLLDCGQGGGGQKTALIPNPTPNSFVVQTNSKVEISEINISNFYGKLVQSRKSSVNHDFDLSGQPAGVYLVEIRFLDGTTEIKKLILEK